MNEADPCFLPAQELIRAYESKTLSPVEAAEAVLARIERLNPALNAFVLVDGEGALAAARAAEEAYARGTAGPLAGVPISFKDVTPTKGMRTTMASVTLKDWVPDFDAVLVERTRAAGASILGKTNAPEFASTFATDNRLFGPTRNPWNHERSAGGSSGGAGAAVASGLGPIGHGNDFAGSIRVPASFCGVFGIKPTMGRIPNNSYTVGVQCFSHEGPLTRTVGDAALFLAVGSGPDGRDAWAMEETPPDFLRTLDEPLQGLRIAWSESFGRTPTEASVLTACEEAARWLAQEVGKGGPASARPDLSGLAESMPLLLGTDNYAMITALVGDRRGELCGLLQQMFARVEAYSAADYALAVGRVARFRYNMRRFFQEYDLLLTPVTSEPAFPIDDPIWGIEQEIPVEGLLKFMFTPPFAMSGNPAASVPVGFTPDGLPIGLQVVGRWGEETTVLRAARYLERERPWAQHHPPEP